MIRGINQMLSKEGIPEGYAYFAKNVQSTILDESINEKGNAIVPSFFSPGFSTVVGVIAFGNLIIIFYIQGGLHNIGVFNELDGSFQVKLSRNDLDFFYNRPITGEAKYNYKQELIVTFTDRVTPPKYINLDTATPSDPVSSYSLSSFVSQPNITAAPLDNSGVIQSGAYMVTVQLVDVNNLGTQWSTLSDVVYIAEHAVTATPTTSFGSSSGKITSKGIKINLTGVNTSYKKIRIALVSRINDVVSASIYKEVNVTATNFSTVVTGSELTTTLTLEEILTPSQYFSAVDNIENLADQLFVGGFKIPPVGDFTPWANAMHLQWSSTPKYQALNAADTLNLDHTNQKGFGHDEIYAFYVRFELPNGTLTQWFHIPGNSFPASPDYRAASSFSSGAGNIKVGTNTIKRYQLEDTCSYVATSGSLSTPNAGYAYGEFSYWENENETYPTGHPYAGQKVRHFKFPSTRWLSENVYKSSIGTTQQHQYLTSMWDVLGVRIVTPSGIPVPAFTRLQLGYAKRDETNTTVLGYDIVQVGGAPVANTSIESSTAGNWEIQAPGSSPENDFTTLKRVLRFHSADLFITRPNITNTYISYLKKMRLNNIGSTTYVHGTFGRISSGESGDVVDVWSFVSNFQYADTSSVVTEGSSYKKLTNAMYIPNNSSTTIGATTINNLLNEECARAEVNADVNIQIADAPDTEYKVDVGGNAYNPNMFEETILLSIKAPKSDMYLSYVDQVVVPCGDFIGITDINIVGHGDVFIAYHSFLAICSAPGLDGPFNFQSDDGCRNFKMFLCESKFNLNERTVVPNDTNTYHLYNPRIGFSTARDFLWVLKIDQNSFPGNEITYSKDFNTLNVYEAYGIYDHNITYRSDYPYAIARSVKASRANSVDDGWRTFLPNDVFYTVNNRGRITNLQALGTDNLLIHHEYALFKTRDKAVLQSDIAKISLGSGDLFALDPQEIVSTDYGMGGTQHKFSCILCEYGYFFVDASAGELLLYKEGNTFTNIGKGFYNFFRKLLKTNTLGDNPINETGITVAYDKENARLVLTLKDIITTYYDFKRPNGGEWYSATDANPSLLIGTRRALYSFKEGAMYKHGVGTRGTYYEATYPAYIDVLVNSSPTITKVLQSVEWITRVEDDSRLVFGDETVTSITIWNDKFCTGKIDIKVYEQLSNLPGTNTAKVDDKWLFNDIKDVVKDLNLPFISDYSTDYRPINTNIATDFAWFQSAPLRGNYFIIRLEYSNLSNKQIAFKAVKPNIVESHG